MNLCACGCGTEVKRKWARGHHVRVNNPSKLNSVKQKRSRFLKEQHALGNRPSIWNKGLRGDPRCISSAQNTVLTRSQNSEWKKKAAEAMKKNRITQRGSEHWAWKGGVSDIVCMLRGNRRLYTVWKRKILERDSFHCKHCNADGRHKLQVHHDQETMAEIITQYVPKDRASLTFDQKAEIREQVIQHHVSHNVSGITLCYKCHKAEHERLKLHKAS